MPEISFLLPSHVWGWYDFLKDFQGLIGGLLALCGVFFTIYFTGRREHQRRIAETEHDRSTLRTALLSELQFLDNRYANMIRSFNTAGNNGINGINVTPYEPDFIYRAMVQKLGLLQPIEVACLIVAYSHARSLIDTLRHENEVTHSGVITVRKLNFGVTVEMLNNGLQRVQNAINTIEAAQKVS